MARKTKDLAEYLRSKLAHDPALLDAVQEEQFNFNVAAEILRAREAASLTQKELAERVGTHQTVISRLENEQYDRHSLSMLNRIAEALGKRLEVRFVDRLAQPQSAAGMATSAAPASGHAESADDPR